MTSESRMRDKLMKQLEHSSEETCLSAEEQRRARIVSRFANRHEGHVPIASCTHELAEHRRGHRHNTLILIGLVILLIVTIVISYSLGRYPLQIPSLLDYFWTTITFQPPEVSSEVISVITNIRFPRITAAVLVGAALAIAGASYQGVFRNPMVSPDILGASAGAGFGASIAILLGFSQFFTQITSFLFGLAAVALTYLISKVVGRRDSTILVLVLAGMVVGAMFQAFVSIIKYEADPFSQLPEITFWLMGGLSAFETEDLLMMLIPLAVGFAVLLALRWRINILSFGDAEASALGVNATHLRLVIIIAATLVTSSAVSVVGQIGWVGLVIPHFARMIVGPNYRYLIPASMLTGAIYLLIVDDIARNLLTMEIPLGILTAVIGAPVFVILLLKSKKGWA